jgi:hypothetical protein
VNLACRTLAIVLLSGIAAVAQNTDALKQGFHAPKEDVEQALKDLNAYQSGRLPFVEGFVGSIDQPLSSFQRAYYQYTISVTQASDSEVSVAVNAKISAWYDDKDPAKSGYRDLPSNGRLEADLLDRLRSRLRQHAAEVAASRTPLVSPKLLGVEAPPPPAAEASAPAPETPPAPSASANPAASRPFATSAGPLKPPSAPTPDQDAKYQRLQKEEKSLNEVLAAQQHPDNLVAVKSPHTPVIAAPAEGSRVLMYADAEDEFQFLKNENGWTHVQISGLNRGWIRTSQLEMAAAQQPIASAAPAEDFKQTKEETSTFPGDWAALRGKSVKIIWVQPTGKSTQKARLHFAETVFKNQAPELAKATGVEGVVIVFDAAEGGMAATTVGALKQWGSGTLSDAAFLKQCWFDPADAFATR